MISTFDSLKTPLEAFYYWEEHKPDAVYLRQPRPDDDTIEYTWAEVGDQARRMAAYLRGLNLEPGSHIALFSKNCPHWVIADLAIWMAGHVTVPLYPNLNADTINYTLNHGDCKLCFVGRLDRFDDMKPGIPEGMPLVAFPYSDAPGGYQNWDEIMTRVAPIDDRPIRSLNDIATIIYTSGTTGNPKGVVHKFLAMSYAIAGALSVFPIEEERFFSYLPMSHVAERVLVEMGSLYTGSLITFAWGLDTFAEDLRDGAPTLFMGVPRIWVKFQEKILEKMPEKKLNRMLKIPLLNNLVRRKVRAALGLSNCRYGLSGAAPITPQLLSWYTSIGIEILEAYGMTENFAYSHFTRPGAQKLGCVGQAVPRADVKISEQGEVLIKSPCSMVGYYKEPEKTSESFEGEYLRTGDKGSIDAEDFLKLTGRVKDLFKTAKGKYVAPSPIEQAIEKDSSIEQICLVGGNIPQPLALVQLSEIGKAMSGEEVRVRMEGLLDEVNPTLDQHERVSHIVICSEPWTVDNGFCTPTLKIKRNVVEQQYGPATEKWAAGQQRVLWED